MIVLTYLGRIEIKGSAASSSPSLLHQASLCPRPCSWVRLSTAQQLGEICLFLLIWGEAANLRFMPELLYAIFEFARTR